MSADSKRRFDDPTVAQEWIPSLFPRNGAENPTLIAPYLPNSASLCRLRRGPAQGCDSRWIDLDQPGRSCLSEEKKAPRVWHVDGDGHDATLWRNNLWLFSQRIFK